MSSLEQRQPPSELKGMKNWIETPFKSSPSIPVLWMTIQLLPLIYVNVLYRLAKSHLNFLQNLRHLSSKLTQKPYLKKMLKYFLGKILLTSWTSSDSNSCSSCWAHGSNHLWPSTLSRGTPLQKFLYLPFHFFIQQLRACMYSPKLPGSCFYLAQIVLLFIFISP